MKKRDLVFVVEDDLFYANVLKSFLESKGYTNIKLYATAEDCIDYLYKCPKLILLDYNLGDRLGQDVLTEVVAFDPNIPVIVISGQESIQSAIDLLKYGAYEYIQKSDEVFTKLESILGMIEVSKKKVEERRVNAKLKKGLVIGSLFALVIFTTLLMLKM